MKILLEVAQRRLDITENTLETWRIDRIKKSKKNEQNPQKSLKD